MLPQNAAWKTDPGADLRMQPLTSPAQKHSPPHAITAYCMHASLPWLLSHNVPLRAVNLSHPAGFILLVVVASRLQGVYNAFHCLRLGPVSHEHLQLRALQCAYNTITPRRLESHEYGCSKGPTSGTWQSSSTMPANDNRGPIMPHLSILCLHQPRSSPSCRCNRAMHLPGLKLDQTLLYYADAAPASCFDLKHTMSSSFTRHIMAQPELSLQQASPLPQPATWRKILPLFVRNSKDDPSSRRLAELPLS